MLGKHSRQLYKEANVFDPRKIYFFKVDILKPIEYTTSRDC